MVYLSRVRPPLRGSGVLRRHSRLSCMPPHPLCVSERILPRSGAAAAGQAVQTRAPRHPTKVDAAQDVGEAGPAHQKTFVIEALVNGKSLGRGVGPNRRVAEAEAATQAVMALLSPQAEAKGESVRGSPE